MTQDAVNAALMGGGGGRAAKFAAHGDTVVGVIKTMEMRQRTDFETNRPMTWDDGHPRMQIVLGLQTEEREDSDDDGLRSLYLPIPSQIQGVVADAVKKTGQDGLGLGGKLGIKFVSTDEPTKRGRQGQKQYSAKYEVPTMPVASNRDIDPDFLPF